MSTDESDERQGEDGTRSQSLVDRRRMNWVWLQENIDTLSASDAYRDKWLIIDDQKVVFVHQDEMIAWDWILDHELQDQAISWYCTQDLVLLPMVQWAHAEDLSR